MRYRPWIIALFGVLAIASGFFITQIKFSFDFEQFFPDGDEDLAFFREFVKEFETDDNFMLVAVRRKEGVFEQQFLEQFRDFTLKSEKLPHVQEVQSLTKFAYPISTPFAITSIPAIRVDNPQTYNEDKTRILSDERFVHNLISKDGKTLVLFLKIIDSIQLEEAQEFMKALMALIEKYEFEEHHFLGRPYFQKEMVEMQKREIIISAIVSALLVSLIMFWIFRRSWGIVISLFSIGLGMLLFMGFLGVAGRELNAMSALYPVLMIIVGTSDVVHIMSKYIDELRKGRAEEEAITITIKEIGLATLLTSVTTAIGFASLLTSRIAPIRDFGLNAAVGVIVAYVTVIFFTTSVISYFKTDQLIKLGRGQAFWEKLMGKTYELTLTKRTTILFVTFIVFGLTVFGMTKITTNYNIAQNMPIGKKITEDFKFFEAELTGFRPMEFAVFAQGAYNADDFAVVKQVAKVEDYLRQFPAIKAIGSITTVYKSINQMFGNNQQEAYRLPAEKEQFDLYQTMAKSIPKLNTNILLSKDGKKTRITSRILDMGADTLKNMGGKIENWISENTDPNIATFKRTGTGLIMDKNAEYIRKNLLQGLGLAMLIVSGLMALLFKNLKMLIISLIPNVFPLLMAGALLGYLGIELEAGISIVFAVIFGIAVDDTIHFLSKFKLAQNNGLDIEEALKVTFLETGKAICLTTVILFFGFLVMLFSIHPPSVTIGLLISLTLFSALISDLFLIPLLIRKWL